MSEAASPPSDATRLPDLASARLGGRVLWATDDFFAPKENLLKPEKPVWREDTYTDRGKWMDGWESRRRRTPGHDSCIVALGLPGIVRHLVVDTSYFRGNYPEHCSLEACVVEGDPSVEELQGQGVEWMEILPKTPLEGDARNEIDVDSPYRFTHLRFHIYPDGGVARLRVHGEVLPDWPRLLGSGAPLDLLAVEHGGRWLAASDMFFSAPQNLLLPGRGVRMDDGWETKRRRGPGYDWVVLELGIAGTIDTVEVDTAHFKGNYPDTCSLEIAEVASNDPYWGEWSWEELLPPTKLEADAVARFAVPDLGSATHARFNIYPDGGVSRLRLWGTPSTRGRLTAGLARFNALLPRQAKLALLDCCGSPAWAREMQQQRPFATPVELFAAADAIWREVGREQWLAAFRSHPEIGGSAAEHAQSAAATGWSSAEQGGARAADADTRAALAEANRAYRERFGHIFIVCATGKGAGEMLELCRQRLGNDPERELEIAAEEQGKITRLRLERLLLG